MLKIKLFMNIKESGLHSVPVCPEERKLWLQFSERNALKLNNKKRKIHMQQSC